MLAKLLAYDKSALCCICSASLAFSFVLYYTLNVCYREKMTFKVLDKYAESSPEMNLYYWVSLLIRIRGFINRLSKVAKISTL